MSKTKANKNNKVTKLKRGASKKQDVKTTLGDLIKDADQAVIVTSVKGNLEVTGIKNINYSYEAKGLLVGALDVYNNRPIMNGLNNNTRAIMSHLVNINNKVSEIVNSKKVKK